MGEPTLGDDLISDASKKTTLARSTKDFIAESICVSIKLYGRNSTFRDYNDTFRDIGIPNSTL